MPLKLAAYASGLWEHMAPGQAREAVRDLAQKLKALAGEASRALDAQAPYLLPAGGIILWTGTACPRGFAEVEALQGAFPMGNPVGGTVGDTGGADTHGHTITVAESGPSSTAAVPNGDGTLGTSTVASSSHQHAPTATAASASNLPPYVQVLFCQKT